jgi:hypothetical protein
MRPRQLTSIYLNENTPTTASAVVPVTAFSVSDSFHSLATANLTVVTNTTGVVPLSASVYVQLVRTTIAGREVIQLFCNYNISLFGGVNGNILLRCNAGAGTPDPLPTDLLITSYGTAQYSTTDTVFPVVGTLQIDGTFDLQMYGVVANGNDQRGMISRTFVV